MEGTTQDLTQWVHKEIIQTVIDSVSTSKALMFRMMEYGKEIGLTKLRVRDTHIQISTGDKIKFKGYYAQKSDLPTYSGSRHLNLSY